MTNLAAEIHSWRHRLSRLLTEKSQAAEILVREKEALTSAEQEVKDTQAAQEHLQYLAQEVQNSAHKQIGRVVSKCLSAVFDRPYELKIQFERKRGRTEAEFIYERDGQVIKPRLTSGGVMQVASLALRLASLVVSLPPAERFLCLDEPFTGVDEVNMEKMGALIETLAEDLGVQFLIATHNPALRIGRVVQL